MPNAVKMGDVHVCPCVDPGPKPHVGGPVMPKLRSVLVDGVPIAIKGDIAFCTSKDKDEIVTGIDSVLVEGVPVADSSKLTKHGGQITATSTVTVGP